MKTIPMNFRFKGRRTYVHGPDIYNSLLRCVGDLLPVDQVRRFRLTMHGFVTRACVLTLGEPGEIISRPGDAKAECVFEFADQRMIGWLTELEAPVTESYEFDEARIEGACVADGDIIRVSGSTGYSAIEVAVSMTKQLHNRLFPNPGAAWVVTGFDLRRIPSDGEAERFEIRFRHNFNNRLTKSELFVGGECIGVVYFSLVKR